MSAAATTARPRRVTARAIEGQELVLLAALAVLWLVLSFAVDTFFTASTLQDLLAAVAPVAIVGVGMTAIIVTGGIEPGTKGPRPSLDLVADRVAEAAPYAAERGVKLALEPP